MGCFDEPIEFFLCHVPERWMAKIMGQSGGFSSFGVGPSKGFKLTWKVGTKPLRNPACDLAHLKGMGEPVVKDMSRSGEVTCVVSASRANAAE